MDENWSRVSKGIKMNDNELGPWEPVSYDNEIIRSFIKKKYIKELRVSMIFDIIFTVVCYFAIIEFLMLNYDYVMTFIMVVLALVFSSLVYTRSRDINEWHKILSENDYDICEVDAFDINISDAGKFCYVKDKDGNILLEKRLPKKATDSADEDPVPAKLTFQGYFAEWEDTSAKLLRIHGLRNTRHYYVFPVYYLQKDKNDKEN